MSKLKRLLEVSKKINMDQIRLIYRQDGKARGRDYTRLPVHNFRLCHWSSQLLDLLTQSSTDVPVLLLNQPIKWNKTSIFFKKNLWYILNQKRITAFKFNWGKHRTRHSVVLCSLFYLSVNVLSTKVLLLFYVPTCRRQHHLTWSSEPGSAVCKANAVPSIFGYFKTLSVGRVPGIELDTQKSYREKSLI